MLNKRTPTWSKEEVEKRKADIRKENIPITVCSKHGCEVIAREETCRWDENKDKSTQVSCLSSHEKNEWKFCPFCGRPLDWKRAK